MTSTISYRLSGVALILGSVLSIVYYLTQGLFLNDSDLKTLVSPLSLNSSLVGLCGSVLLLLGLPGLHARQASRAGILGLPGFLFVWYVTLFQGVLIPFTTVTLIPSLEANTATLALATTAPPTWLPFELLSMVGQVLGILLLGIATLRAGVFPRWPAWLLIATLVVGVISHLPFFPDAVSNLTALLGSLAIAGLGYALLQPRQLERKQPVPAAADVGAHA